MENGYVMPGETCKHSEKCGGFKLLACNGEGCPVADGKTTNVRFSCAASRAFAMIDEAKASGETGEREKVMEDTKKCERCGGWGRVVQGSFPLESFVKCKQCKGTGRVSNLFPAAEKSENSITKTDK